MARARVGARAEVRARVGITAMARAKAEALESTSEWEWNANGLTMVKPSTVVPSSLLNISSNTIHPKESFQI